MQTENQRKYNEYVEEVKEAVEKETGKRVIVQKVTKNNGVVLDGLTILTEELNVAPTIYLNDYYEEYLSDGAVAVAKRIIAVYEANKPSESVDISFFTDMEKVRPNIKMKLINYEKNKALLENVPHVKFLDLAIVFIAVMECNYDNNFASILIHNHHMNFWDMNTEDLYNLAMENTASDFEIIPMSSVIKAIMDEESADIIMGSIDAEISILTTHFKMHGAAGMLYKDILNQYMQEKQTEKVMILPSSIHEVLLLPFDSSVNMKYFHNMVREINATQVKPGEVLSNNIYVYDGDTITIAK